MDTYEIVDGVRRAKAADLAGHDTIWAVVDGDAHEQKVPVHTLLSPKRVIDITTPRELKRWRNVVEGMREEPDLLPPIVIRPGSNGIPIRDVPVVGGPP